MSRTRTALLAGLLAGVGLVGVAGQVAVADGPCGDDVAWERPGGTVVCIHADERDEVRAERRRVAAFGGNATAAATTPWGQARDADELQLVCDRSSDAHRLKVLYVYPEGDANRLASRRAEIDRALALAQSQYDMSSEWHGASSAWIPRFVTEAAGPDGCRAAITAVRVSPSIVVGEAEQFFDHLEARGHDDPDRTYVALVDTSSVQYCGLGTIVPDDDHPSPAVNQNNQRFAAAFVRVDRPCWEDVVGHEIGHTLGAVLNDAPHATGPGGYHCTDGLDAMCYDDGTAAGAAYSDDVCTAADAAFVLDCNGDDYFNPSPSSGSWLADHWNLTSSDWLLRTNLRSWERGGTVAASGTIFDDVSHANVFAMDVTDLAAAGVTRGCNPPANTRYCPGNGVTREQMAAFLTRTLKLPPAPETFVDVPADSIFAGDIGALAKAGITRGCNPPSNTRFCPSDTVTREQMAAFLVRTGEIG